MPPKWCRICGSFLINPEKQTDPDEVEDIKFIPNDYKYFVVFLIGMILGALVSQIGG